MNMSLRSRILLGYLVPLVLMLGVALAVYWSTGTLRQISASLDQSRKIAEQIDDVHLSVIKIERSTRGYVLVRNDATRKDFETEQSKVHETLRILGDEAKDPAQLAKLGQLAQSINRLVGVEQNFIDLVDAGKAPKAVEFFRTEGSIALVAEIEALIQEINKREAEIVEARHEAQTNAMATLMTVVLGATLLAAAIALVVGAWIAAIISRSLGEAVGGLSTSSAEIAATVDEHERAVTQQAAAVNETTSTIEELSASSRQSANQADNMAQAAKQSLDATEAGIRLANQVSQSMNGMKQKVGSVAQQILRLSEQAGQIGGIAKVVGDLAGESNMLALNAAVEAARAGEHGKGFAVVAAEVRKLADQSKKSAERTNALVAEIQKATNSAVMVTEEGTRTAEEVAAIIEKTIEAFGAISATANSVAVSAQQVLLNSKQQASALGQVTDAMKSLAAGSLQMATGTGLTKKGVQKLNSVAQSLQAMV